MGCFFSRFALSRKAKIECLVFWAKFHSNRLTAMGRRINWDAANRQNKLRKWLRDHGDYSWVDELPPTTDHDLDKWARGLVQRSVRRVRSRLREKELPNSSLEGKIGLLLKEISTLIDQGEIKLAKSKASEILNFALKQGLTSIERDLRNQITETIGLLLILPD